MDQIEFFSFFFLNIIDIIVLTESIILNTIFVNFQMFLGGSGSMRNRIYQFFLFFNFGAKYLTKEGRELSFNTFYEQSIKTKKQKKLNLNLTHYGFIFGIKTHFNTNFYISSFNMLGNTFLGYFVFSTPLLFGE